MGGVCEERFEGLMYHQGASLALERQKTTKLDMRGVCEERFE
jgi:hypothetical protein